MGDIPHSSIDEESPTNMEVIPDSPLVHMGDIPHSSIDEESQTNMEVIPDSPLVHMGDIPRSSIDDVSAQLLLTQTLWSHHPK